MADAALICAAIGFVFLRLVFMPFQGAPAPAYSRFFLVGLLACVLSLVASAQWRWVVDPEWRTIYGSFGLAALIYGALNSVASGFARELQPAGSLSDLGWIIPFVLLAAAALPPQHAPRPAFSSSLIVVLAGAGPVALDGLLGLWLPAAGLPFEPRPLLLVSVSAVMALGCLVRLLLEERASQRMRHEERARAEESRRAGRLQALASLSASLVEDLERAMAALLFQARSAAPHLGDKAERVLEQAQRAQEIVRGMVDALPPGAPRPSPDGRHRSVAGRGGALRVRRGPVAARAARRHAPPAARVGRSGRARSGVPPPDPQCRAGLAGRTAHHRGPERHARADAAVHRRRAGRAARGRPARVRSVLHDASGRRGAGAGTHPGALHRPRPRRGRGAGALRVRRDVRADAPGAREAHRPACAAALAAVGCRARGHHGRPGPGDLADAGGTRALERGVAGGGRAGRGRGPRGRRGTAAGPLARLLGAVGPGLAAGGGCPRSSRSPAHRGSGAPRTSRRR